jgi:predicted Zn-dependent peptidase
MDDMPIDYLDQREAAIRKTTAADVQRVAQRILDFNKVTTVLVGTPEGIANGTVVEKLPNVE